MIIYKITNIATNQHYIGLTKQKFNECVSLHKSNAFTKKLEQNVYIAMREFGWEKFEFQILENSENIENPYKKLNEYIDQYDSFNNGYNMTLSAGSGVLGLKHTDKSKQLISKSTNKSRHLQVGENAPHFGKNHSEETKQHIAENLSLNWKITDELGNIQIIKNMNNFCKDKGLNVGAMYLVAQGKRKQHQGFKCEKVDKEPTTQENLCSDI